MNAPPLRRSSLLLAAALSLLAVGCGAGARPARANSTLASMMMDDDALVYTTPSRRAAVLDAMRKLGVQGIRVTVSWKFLAGDLARRPARLRGNRAASPAGYSPRLWNDFDHLIEAAYGDGLFVLFNVTGPGPSWAQGRAPLRRRFDQPAWKPNAAAFGQFVQAVATRYSGSYHDENDQHRLLPRVTIWSLYNEPNQPASLAPQMDYSRLLHRQIPMAPILYRELYYAASNALRATGHSGDTILMGETAPLGALRHTPRVHLWPKLFLREMFCVAPNGRPYTGLQARARRCSELQHGGPFLISGFAHHPYMQKSAPGRLDPNPNSINMANVGDLPTLLDQLAATTHLIPAGLPVYLTESGWETFPPDPVHGIPLALQGGYMNIADRLAYDQPRVVAQTQFVFRDVAPVARYRGRRSRLAQYWATWQSGIEFANGRQKPSFTAYAMPLDIYPVSGPTSDGGRDVRAWGQLRFLPPGQNGQVQFQFRGAGSRQWNNAGGPMTVPGPVHFYDLRLHASAPGVWRAVTYSPGFPVVSREISVSF